MNFSDGIVVILSYPDTIVRPAYWERSSKIWPKIGIGSKHGVQAGHAALLLIKKNNPEILYFDFGRYITSYGNGRVRSAKTDPELKVPIKAIFKNEQLVNIEEILLWIENNPKKTHGDGRLIAGFNVNINYANALNYIESIIEAKEIPYGAFVKNGSNCARFVTDTIINSCNNKKTILKLKSSYLLTPSPIGNVLKGSSEKEIHLVEKQQIKRYTNKSILIEYKKCFFNKCETNLNLIGSETPDLDVFNLQKGTWLGGIGSGAWFDIDTIITKNTYRIKRYTSDGLNDFEGDFRVNKETFNIDKEHTFVYPTNCIEAFVLQNNTMYAFKIID